MGRRLGIGLLGLGTVGAGVARILQNPKGRNPLIKDLELVKVAVKQINRTRGVELDQSILTTNPESVIDDPSVDIVVEVIGGIEPARSLILRAIASGKSVVTANKAVIAHHGKEIAEAAALAGVYVLIEAAVGGGIPIIEPLKQSLGANKIQKITGIINGTTNYILSRIADEGIPYDLVLKEAQKLGYAESNPRADVDGLDSADKIAILSGLAFGGNINRALIPTKGISGLRSKDIEYSKRLGYVIKLLALAENFDCLEEELSSIPLAVSVQPMLVPIGHPLANVNGVNNAILIEGEPVGSVMFYGPGAGSGPTSSAVVADILNIAGVKHLDNSKGLLDPLLAASTWRKCHLVESSSITQRNYIRLKTKDNPGVIGKVGSCFGRFGVSIQSIVQFDSSDVDAEIVVITHEVRQGQIQESLDSINSLPEVMEVVEHLGCL